ADDSRLETAMSLLIAHATTQRTLGKTGQPSVTVLDECWCLLDSPVLAPETSIHRARLRSDVRFCPRYVAWLQQQSANNATHVGQNRTTERNRARARNQHSSSTVTLGCPVLPNVRCVVC